MKVGVLATMVFATLVAYPIASFAGLAPDADGDGIPDVLDKCTLDSRNVVSPCDADVDGYGDVCDGDFDQNFSVSTADFSTFFVPAFKGLDPAPWPQGMDMDCNGSVSTSDFSGYFVPKFKGLAPGGNHPGPSGLSCAGTAGCM
jgi:Thrombospondin type 3 repeat